MNTSLNPCSHEKSPELIGLSNITTYEIFNPSCFPFIKLFKGWLQMHMFITNIANLVGMNLEIGTWSLVLEGKPPHQLSMIWRFPKDELISQNKHFRETTRAFTFCCNALVRWEYKYNCENIPLGIFVTNHSRFEAKIMKGDEARYVQPFIMQHLITSIQTWFFSTKFKLGDRLL